MLINNPGVVAPNQPDQTVQGYTTFPFMSPTLNQGGNSSSLVANVVRGIQTVLPVPVIIRKTVIVLNGTTAAQYKYDFGLYDLSGNRLVHSPYTVAQGSAGAQSVVIASVTIQPGVYNYCWTVDTTNASNNLFAQGGADFDMCKLLSALGSVYTFTAANASVAGVLPATLGVLTTDNFTTTGTYPPMWMTEP